MKKISVIAVAFLMTTNVYSQYKLKVGDAQLNGGFGLSTWGAPVYVGFDYGVHKYMSVGAELSYRSYIDGWHDRQNTLTLLGNGNFHFSGLLEIPDEWDIYMGFNVGGYYNSASTGRSSSGAAIGGQFGGRYYFTDNWGLNLEVGGGSIFDWGKIGITYVF